MLLDGGVRRGSDVIKAMALGATACLIGRPQLWALSVAGEDGVSHLLDMFRREIDRAMGLCGLRSLDEAGPDLLMRKERWLQPPASSSTQPQKRS